MLTLAVPINHRFISHFSTVFIVFFFNTKLRGFVGFIWSYLNLEQSIVCWQGRQEIFKEKRWFHTLSNASESTLHTKTLQSNIQHLNTHYFFSLTPVTFSCQIQTFTFLYHMILYSCTKDKQVRASNISLENVNKFDVIQSYTLH